MSTLMLDISVGVAQYPSRDMARRTLDTRPIGLGLANVAGLLTRLGIAYDSEAARATVASITALLTAEAANSSADLAKELGAFSEFAANREAMLALIRNRREAIPTEAMPQAEVAEVAARLFDMAKIKTEAYGARNAQLTCVPPTSTIARVMDCETLGLAPSISAMRHGSSKSLTPSVVYGLQAMGLSAPQIDDVARHVCGHRSLAGSPAISHASLRAQGFGEVQLQAVEEALRDAADIHAAFDPWVLGERFCRDYLRMAQSEMYDAGFKVLQHLGYGAEEIAAANRHACGHGSLAMAPHLNPVQRASFATVTPQAQIAMLAAVQPFVTGGIAHTITLPQDTSVEQCEQLIWQAWRGGLTSISFQRDASALYQDVSADNAMVDEAEPIVFREAVASLSGGISEIAASLAQRFMQSRRELPMRRHGFTQKTEIGGQVVYLRTGEYTEGDVGEVFLDLPKEQQLTRALAQHFTRAMSLGLQHGVPLTVFVEAFANPGGARDAMAEELAEESHAILEYMFAELAQVYLAEPETAKPEGRAIRLAKAN